MGLSLATEIRTPKICTPLSPVVFWVFFDSDLYPAASLPGAVCKLRVEKTGQIELKEVRKSQRALDGFRFPWTANPQEISVFQIVFLLGC